MKRTAVALVDEPRCIGCARCIEACPVDAIAGAPGFLHTVIADFCTGCELCLPPCPVDCIDMISTTVPWTKADAEAAKSRAAFRNRRISDAIPKTTRKDRKVVIAAALRRKQKA